MLCEGAAVASGVGVLAGDVGAHSVESSQYDLFAAPGLVAE